MLRSTSRFSFRLFNPKSSIKLQHGNFPIQSFNKHLRPYCQKKEVFANLSDIEEYINKNNLRLTIVEECDFKELRTMKEKVDREPIFISKENLKITFVMACGLTFIGFYCNIEACACLGLFSLAGSPIMFLDAHDKMRYKNNYDITVLKFGKDMEKYTLKK